MTGCCFCKQWRFKDDRGVFINKSLCLRRQVFTKFVKRSAVFIVVVKTIHSIVDKLGTLSHILVNILARISGNIVQDLFCQSDRKSVVNINRGVTKAPRAF